MPTPFAWSRFACAVVVALSAAPSTTGCAPQCSLDDCPLGEICNKSGKCIPEPGLVGEGEHGAGEGEGEGAAGEGEGEGGAVDRCNDALVVDVDHVYVLGALKLGDCGTSALTDVDGAGSVLGIGFGCADQPGVASQILDDGSVVYTAGDGRPTLYTPDRWRAFTPNDPLANYDDPALDGCEYPGDTGRNDFAIDTPGCTAPASTARRFLYQPDGARFIAQCDLTWRDDDGALVASAGEDPRALDDLGVVLVDTSANAGANVVLRSLDGTADVVVVGLPDHTGALSAHTDGTGFLVATANSADVVTLSRVAADGSAVILGAYPSLGAARDLSTVPMDREGNLYVVADAGAAGSVLRYRPRATSSESIYVVTANTPPVRLGGAVLLMSR